MSRMLRASLGSFDFYESDVQHMPFPALQIFRGRWQLHESSSVNLVDSTPSRGYWNLPLVPKIITKIIQKFPNSASVIEINSKNLKFCICNRKIIPRDFLL